jgi:hypothetical protein
MTYPQQPYPPQAQPGYPQGYPPPEMPGQSPGFGPGYPPQQAQQPPVQNGGPVPSGTNPYSGNGFPPSAQPWGQPGPQQFQPPQGYPQQQWGQPGPQQFQPPPQQFSLDDFHNQPSGPNGPSVTKLINGNQWPVGTEWLFVIKRDVGDSDVSQQTEMNSNRLLFNKDGTPKLSIAVHVEAVQIVMNGQIYNSPNHPDGNGTWYIQGRARDEWARARQEAGCPAKTAGLRGERVRVKLAGRRPIPGVPQPANDWEMHVTPVNGPAPQPAPLAQPQAGQPGPIASTPAAVAQAWQPVADAAAMQQYQQVPPGAVQYDNWPPAQQQAPTLAQALPPPGQVPNWDQASPAMQAALGQPQGLQPAPQQAQQAPAQQQPLSPPPSLNEQQAALLQQFQQGKA